MNSIAEITALIKAAGEMIAAFGPTLAAIGSLVGVFLTYRRTTVLTAKLADNTKKTEAVAVELVANTTETKNVASNIQMAALAELLKNEGMTIGEKIGLARGRLEAAERQEAELAAREKGELAARVRDAERAALIAEGQRREIDRRQATLLLYSEAALAAAEREEEAAAKSRHEAAGDTWL